MNTHPHYIVKSTIEYTDNGASQSEEELFYENKSWSPVNKKLESTVKKQGLAEGFLNKTELYRVYRNNNLVELIQLKPKQ